MNRRTFLTASAAALAAGSWPRTTWANDSAAGWRRFEISLTVAIAEPKGETRLWLPVPSTIDPGWAEAGEPRLTSTGTAKLDRDASGTARLVSVVIPASTPVHRAEVVTAVATRDRQVDPAAPAADVPLSAQERAFFTRGTALIPVDGIVRETALAITSGAGGELDKARALYEWVVENTFRDPKTRGCGAGYVAGMLRSGTLGGKCADINALYVGLARAVGLPARDVYGIRVAPSRRGYRSLGTASATISKAQHCRAEVWLAGLGWVPVDPADVRKVALEEPPGNLSLASEPVQRARDTLFGGWEMNWAPYNTAHDLALAGYDGPPLPFLMYPIGQTGQVVLDSLDPDAFGYTITSRELNA